MSKSKKVKKLNDKLKKEFAPPPLEVAFDCTKNGNDPNPFYHPQTNPRAWLSCHISDDCMRNILHVALVDLGMQDCTNEELCKFMVDNDIWDESQASVWVLNYIANKGVDTNDS